MHDVFYFTDIHGAGALYDAIMKFCKEQDDECMIIFGGDACDRGRDGYRIIKELLNNPHVVYLKGNHEDMLVKAMYEIKEHFGFEERNRAKSRKVLNACMYFGEKYIAIQDSIANGGLDTLLDWIEDGMPLELTRQLENLPLTYSYKQYDFCHAGGGYNTFKSVQQAEQSHLPIPQYDIINLLWDRYSFAYGWAPNRICVHGHTPTTHLPAKYYGKDKSNANIHPCKWIGDFDLEKYNGWRLDMDTGVFATNRIFILDINNNVIHGFEEKNNKIIQIEDIQL